MAGLAPNEARRSGGAHSVMELLVVVIFLVAIGLCLYGAGMGSW